jgi:hypothetical protein
MSHFTVLVFGSEEQVETLLAPFDENIEMPEYCNGVVSQEDKDDFVSYYTEKQPACKNLSFEEMYEIYGKSWNDNTWRKLDNVLCSFTTYNPKSKWDWYQIGGRWDKAIRNNSCKVKTLPDDFVPFAFVDQYGEWHEKAEMWWWAITSNDKDEEDWKQEFHNALEKYDGFVTLVDCHI